MPAAEMFRGSADAYDQHVGRYSAALASALIDVACITPGASALDVGCGRVGPSAPSARRSTTMAAQRCMTGIEVDSVLTTGDSP